MRDVHEKVARLLLDVHEEVARLLLNVYEKVTRLSRRGARCLRGGMTGGAIGTCEAEIEWQALSWGSEY